VEHERRGVFNATAICLSGLRHDPGGVRIMHGVPKAFGNSRAFDKGECHGVWQERIRPEARRVSGLWLKNSPALNNNDSNINFGESPDTKLLLTVKKKYYIN